MGCCSSESKEPKKKILYRCQNIGCDKGYFNGYIKLEEGQPIPDCCDKPMVKVDDKSAKIIEEEIEGVDHLKIVKTKKPHDCNICGTKIPKNSRIMFRYTSYKKGNPDCMMWFCSPECYNKWEIDF